MRSIDKLIVGTFLVFFLIALTIDYINAVAPMNKQIRDEDTSKWSWPPAFILKLFYWWGHNVDPLLLTNESITKVLAILSPFVFAPFYLIGIYAICYKKRWIRMPMLLYALVLFLDLGYFFYQAIFGLEKSKNLVLFTLGYGYYQVFPLILIYRFWSKDVFETKRLNRKKTN
ncbi:unnamed protein product [Adineta ricciae]|uniref:EXPERA domain-containing protein n=1 Tax=Adineta ricciae TaxID=249248 RepID=A0A815JPX0_ADIRI|nr:unnamed protein product [Adineta ricciae]CAF1381924.1 unnamed protein product [Adineta ricciae]